MKNIILLLLAIMSIGEILAQNNSNATSSDLKRGENSITTYFMNGLNDNDSSDKKRFLFDDYVGHPYEYKDFKAGKLSKNDVFEDMVFFLRYNIFSDEIEIDNGDNNIGSLNKSPIIVASIDGDLYRYYDSYIIDGKVKQGYLKTIHSFTEYSLILDYDVSFTEPKLATTGYDSDRKATFNQSKNYYILLKNKNKFIEFPMNLKNLSELIEGTKKEIKSYMKASRMSLKNEADLIKLINKFPLKKEIIQS